MGRREVVTRRRLPHWYMPGAAHFVTYRLAGSLPRNVVDQLNAQRDRLLARRPEHRSLGLHRYIVHKRLFSQYDTHLDCARTVRWLSDPRVADMVRENLYHHHGSKYHLLSWCLMSNHVHVLLIPKIEILPEDWESPVGEADDAKSPLSGIMHSLKSYTAHRANEILGRSGSFWQRESYDHWVRDDDELERIVSYIRGNPVKAGLVERPELWQYSSCYDRFQLDGDRSGWLPHGFSVPRTARGSRAPNVP